MAITSSSDYLAAAKQRAVVTKTSTRASIGATPFSVFDLAGSPGAGVLAGTNTAKGVVPVDNDAGYPTLGNFAAGATGAVTRFAFSSNVACRLSVYDRVYLAGAYNFDAAVTLASQPSYAARMPGGSYRETELWIEAVTAFTGIQTVEIKYTNDLGVAGRTTGPVSVGVAATVGRCTQLPLQAGDTGIQRVESVTSTVATAGTFNVMVLRPLLSDGVRVRSANDGDSYGMQLTGLVPVTDSAAIYTIVTPDGTNTGLASYTMEIASKV